MQHITFLMPVKNGSRFLYDSLANLLEISRPNDEILIVNDYSTDNTTQIIENFSRMHPRVNLINNKEPGLVGALNLGIKESKNDWIARCDVDDKYTLNRAEVQQKEISKNPVAIFSDYTFFSESIKNLGRMPSALTKQAVSVSLAMSQRSAHSSVLFNRLAVQDAGGYIAEDFPAEDLSLWLRLSRVGDLVSTAENLMFYRLDSNSISFQKRKEILSKKRELMKSIGINLEDYLFTCNNLLEILKGYDGEELGNQRKLLLIREILTIKQNPSSFSINSKRLDILNKRFIIEISKFQSFSDIYHLNSCKKKRNKIRGLV
jgi:glycosyltransferase involved in cell wall biosynthesis